ncbi:MAG TPA: hypothetical protein VJ719_13660 [Chthoniobacterales bacterium]|nr:hypothetical protein [Chthoniobacterales bacterium]
MPQSHAVMISLVLSLMITGIRADGQATTTGPVVSPTQSENEPAQKSAIGHLIPWLLSEQSELRGIAFSEVISSATGKRVLPIDPKNETDAKIVRQISSALDQTLKQLNSPESRVQKAERINEVSSQVEETLRELLNANPDLKCEYPRTAEDKVQRSGYPDLRIVDTATKRVFYLDPKLYATGSRDSSFRTFYFEPKVATNKIRDDAVHLVAGLEHDLRSGGHWQFTRWDLVDLSRFQVKLKAEFQGSNRDMYRPEAIVATSEKRHD